MYIGLPMQILTLSTTPHSPIIQQAPGSKYTHISRHTNKFLVRNVLTYNFKSAPFQGNNTCQCTDRVGSADNALNFLFGKCLVRISARTPTILKSFVVFLDPSRNMAGDYPELNYDCLLPRLSQFTIHRRQKTK
jgi:hypothetical protein